MKRASLPASPGFWTCVVVSAVLVLGGGTGVLAWLATSQQKNITAQTTIDQSSSPAATSAHRNPMPSLGAPMTSRGSIAAVQPAVLTQPAQDNEDQPASAMSGDTGTAHPPVTDSAHAMLSDWNAAGATSVDFEPGANRLLADSTGATRVLDFNPEAFRSLLNSSTLDAGLQEKSQLIEVNDYWAPRDTATIDDLNGRSLDLSSFSRGIPESDLQDHSAFSGPEPTSPSTTSDSPKKVSSAAGAQLQYSNDPEEQPRPTSEIDVPAGIAMTPGKNDHTILSDRPIDSPARDNAGAVRLVPEPMAMPVLICGWLLVARPRRRRLAECISSDQRSFKLPPGSSDLTIDQLHSARRITLAVAAC